MCSFANAHQVKFPKLQSASSYANNLPYFVEELLIALGLFLLIIIENVCFYRIAGVDA